MKKNERDTSSHAIFDVCLCVHVFSAYHIHFLLNNMGPDKLNYLASFKTLANIRFEQDTPDNLILTLTKILYFFNLIVQYQPLHG